MCWQFIRPYTPVRLSDGRPPLLTHFVCVPRAVSTFPGSPDRHSCVHPPPPRTTDGPPTCRPTPTRRTSHPTFPFHRRSEHERRAPPRIARRPRAPLAPRALCPDGAVPLRDGGRRRRCRRPSNCTPRLSRTTQATS